MIIRKRPVAILQLPEQCTRTESRTFTREVKRSMTATRPYLVLDCSNIRRMDNSIVQLLLHCLEEAMKRNGNVKLAGIPPAPSPIFGTNGANRLFEIFDTTVDAVNSFHELSFEDLSQAAKSESAA